MVVIHTPIASPGTTSSNEAARVFKSGKLFSHLMASTKEELVAYARSISIPLKWIQYPDDPVKVHFDVTGRRLAKILQDDRVVKMTLREWVDWRKEIRGIK